MLNLYRSIIRLHRKKLPPALRTMGNTYVRHEFDLHKKANLTQVIASVLNLSWAVLIFILHR
jgi:hypothetical protein